MPEHRIKFRGGWESSLADGEVGRLSLPIAWPEAGTGMIRLTRRFGRPALDPQTETTWLEFRFVPGLRLVQLNDVDLGIPPAGASGWWLALGGVLEARNTLRLDVDLGLVKNVETSEGWGWIALVITPISSAVGPGDRAGGVGNWTEMP